MQLGKISLSIFLLFAYTLGVAQHLLPHCHHSEVFISGHQDDHYHHLPTNKAESDHDHPLLLHRNHLDAGLLDLLLCIIQEAEHTPEEAGHQFCQVNVLRPGEKIKTKVLENGIPGPLVALPAVPSLILCEESTSSSLLLPNPFFLNYQTLRGPPDPA